MKKSISQNFRFIKFIWILLLIAGFSNSDKVIAQQSGFKNPKVNESVYAIALQPDGKILIGGFFTSINNVTRNRVARLNQDGSLDTGFNPNLNGYVLAMILQSDGKILVGGDFTTVGGVSRTRIARLNSDGSLDDTFQDSSPNNFVWTITEVPDGKILIGGGFQMVSGQARRGVARLNSNGSLDTSFQDPNVSGEIYSIALKSDGQIYIGGGFTSVGGQNRVALARLNSDGSFDSSFQALIPGGNVDKIVLQSDGRILIGGSFTSIGGVTRRAFARLNIDGTLDLSFQALGDQTFGTVKAIVFQPDGKILIGGDFTITVGELIYRNVARLNSDGSFDTSFQNVSVSSTLGVVAIVLQPDGKILIGGGFSSVGNIPRANVARLNTNGTLDIPPPTTFTVTKMGDTNDGLCNADCSLREAITAANDFETLDTIEFDQNVFNQPQTITLSGTELNVANNSNLTVNGRGAELLTISGNNQSRVFFISNGTKVTINGVKITNGNGIGTINSGVGGGILNNGVLNLNNSIVSGNRTTTGGGGGIGNNSGGQLSVTKSTVNNNSSNNRDGGGISNGFNSVVNLIDSTLSSNQASSGAGIYNFSTLVIKNSTISGNSAILFGGGILNDGLNGAITTVNSSTVSNNTAGSRGGGVSNESGTIYARNNIFANNTAISSALDFSGNLNSQGYNLIEHINGAAITGITTGNILGQDPQLLPLGNYGGATQTHALRANSPAIDKGNSFGVDTDQRGQIRPFDFPNIPNAPGGNGSDIGAFERQPNDISGSTLFDFDGDGKSDISVFRPSNGIWYLQQSTAGFGGLQFGASTDKLVPADYDGDGKTDVAVYRDGNWFIQRSQMGFTSIQFGESTDIPVPADYDGDGKADVAVYRPSSGTWFVQRSSLGFSAIQFGSSEDKPVAADFDGDGKSDYAVFRPSTGIWYVQQSTAGFTGLQFGSADDKLVVADYDGDGRADYAVYRPSTGFWYLMRSQLGFTGIQFGQPGDVPVPADYDGDGRADIAVYRNDTWYLQRSTAGFLGVQFGSANDQPVPNAFVR